MTGAEHRIAESIRAFNDADWETMRSMWDPQGAIVAPAMWPEGGTMEGWPAIKAEFERLKADFSEDEVRPLTIEEVRPGVVLAALRWTGTGAASGLDFDVPTWMVGTVREGLIVRTEYFLEESAARAAAGV